MVKPVEGPSAHEAHEAGVTPPSKKRGLFSKLRRKDKKAATHVSSGSSTSTATAAGAQPSPRPGGSSATSSVAGTPRAASSEVPMDLAGPEDFSGGTDGVQTRKKLPAGTLVGTTTLELTFFPFKRNGVEVSPEAAAAAAGAEIAEGAETVKPLPVAVTSVRKTLQEASFKGPNPKQKGVLTLFLKKVLNLSAACDTYVTVR